MYSWIWVSDRWEPSSLGVGRCSSAKPWKGSVGRPLWPSTSDVWEVSGFGLFGVCFPAWFVVEVLAASNDFDSSLGTPDIADDAPRCHARITSAVQSAMILANLALAFIVSGWDCRPTDGQREGVCVRGGGC